MLSKDEIDVLANRIARVYGRFHTSVLESIARHLANLEYSAAEWQVRRAIEAGLLIADIANLSRGLSGEAEDELGRILADAAELTLAFDDKIYQAAGLAPMPMHLNPNMARILTIGFNRTMGTMSNFTGTTVLLAQKAFIDAADQAYMQVVTGTFSYQDAIRSAVKKVVGEGVNVRYASGAREHIDSAMRKVVLTGVGKTAGDIQMERAKELGVKHVEVSAHMGARNRGTGPMNHEEWQGKVYSLYGDEKYDDFITTTGYGTGEGLHGWNCRHSFYPFFEGLSKAIYDQKSLDELKNDVTYRGKKMSQYEASQIQRYIERNIRMYKREKAALEAAGLDASSAKIRSWQARMREFTTDTGLYRQWDREQIN